MKKIISYALCLMITASVVAAPDTKLVESFNTTFPNAKNVKWSDNKDGYFVSFTSNGHLRKVCYDKKGEFVCSWNYTNEDALPTSIKMDLNEKYPDAEFVGVTEVTISGKTMYDVKLTHGTKLYVLDILADGTVVKQEKFTNQNAVGVAAKKH